MMNTQDLTPAQRRYARMEAEKQRIEALTAPAEQTPNPPTPPYQCPQDYLNPSHACGHLGLIKELCGVIAELVFDAPEHINQDLIIKAREKVSRARRVR